MTEGHLQPALHQRDGGGTQDRDPPPEETATPGAPQKTRKATSAKHQTKETSIYSEGRTKLIQRIDQRKIRIVHERNPPHPQRSAGEDGPRLLTRSSRDGHQGHFAGRQETSRRCTANSNTTMTKPHSFRNGARRNRLHRAETTKMPAGRTRIAE